MPKLGSMPFETVIIERYRRQETPVEKALGEFYPEVRWQRFAVHWYRNVFRVVPRSKRKALAAMLRAIHAQEARNAAEGKAITSVG